MRPFVLACVAALACSSFSFVASASERCVLDAHPGIGDADAETAADVVCSEVERRTPPGARYHVRIGRLGSSVVVALEVERGGGAREREQLVVSDVSEVPVAAPRLADAIAQHRPASETADTTNIVGGETRAPKRKPSEVHGLLEPVALVLPAYGASGGARVGMSIGTGRWAFVTDVTMAGYSFTGVLNVFGGAFQDSYSSKKDVIKNPGVGYAALAAGTRYFISDADTSFWLGGGAALDYVGVAPASTNTLSSRPEDHASNFGAAAYGELGFDFARTHKFGGTVGVRCDAPAYTIDTATYSQNGVTTRTSNYTPIVTFGVGLRL